MAAMSVRHGVDPKWIVLGGVGLLALVLLWTAG